MGKKTRKEFCLKEQQIRVRGLPSEKIFPERWSKSRQHHKSRNSSRIIAIKIIFKTLDFSQVELFRHGHSYLPSPRSCHLALFCHCNISYSPPTPPPSAEVQPQSPLMCEKIWAKYLTAGRNSRHFHRAHDAQKAKKTRLERNVTTERMGLIKEWERKLEVAVKRQIGISKTKKKIDFL